MADAGHVVVAVEQPPPRGVHLTASTGVSRCATAHHTRRRGVKASAPAAKVGRATGVVVMAVVVVVVVVVVVMAVVVVVVVVVVVMAVVVVVVVVVVVANSFFFFFFLVCFHSAAPHMVP